VLHEDGGNVGMAVEEADEFGSAVATISDDADVLPHV
jgi:hypothetical protein